MILYIQPLKMELTEASETSTTLHPAFEDGTDSVPNRRLLYIQPLKMELTEGSETSANHNLTPGTYPKEHIQPQFKIHDC
jgi:hypothetical protein